MSCFAVLFALLSLPTQDPYSLPGPFSWGEQTVTAPGPTPAGTSAKVYYPAVAQGTGTPIDTSSGSFPLITFAPGFFASPSFYDSTLRHLASRGYIVIATTSEQFNPFPDRARYLSNLVGTIDYMVAENSRAGSFFENRINVNEIGASGHSLGGGISIVLASIDSRVKASATLAAASLRDAGPLGSAPPPYADVEVSKLDIPVSLINGSADGLIPVATNGQVIYNSGLAPKLLPNVVGGFHAGFTDFPFPINETPGISGADQLAFSRAELTSFFDLYLKNDQDAWRRQWGPERLLASGDPGSILAQLDPGFDITTSETSNEGLPGSLVKFLLTITNHSTRADQYDLFAEDNQWGLTFATQETPLLNPGDSFSLLATVSIPNLEGFASDKALVSARSRHDGGTRAWIEISTSTVPEVPSLLLTATGVGAVYFAGRRRKVTSLD